MCKPSLRLDLPLGPLCTLLYGSVSIASIKEKSVGELQERRGLDNGARAPGAGQRAIQGRRRRFCTGLCARAVVDRNDQSVIVQDVKSGFVPLIVVSGTGIPASTLVSRTREIVLWTTGTLLAA